MSSEGSEETKIISAQVLAIPMLKQSSSDAIFNDPSMKMLIDSLLKDSAYGPKLTCELLQIIDILLDRMHAEDMTDCRKDLLKFIWAVLRNNDPSTKYYAHLAVSRFISVFDTPSKVILQVYRSLLRDTSERNTVRAAMDVLLPSLKNRLGKEIDHALVSTLNIMREEGNSIPQIAHLMESITRHPSVYMSYKLELIPHMLTSLSLLGQPNASLELTKLSVALAKLIFDWGILASKSQESCQDQVTHKSMSGLDQKSIETILNILMRLAFATAAGKPDQLRLKIRAQILSLLKDFVSSQKNCKIKSAHIKKALLHKPASKSRDNKEGAKSSQSTRKESSDSKADDDEGVKSALLLCVEIVLLLLRHDPTNVFIEKNICTILRKCIGITTGEKTQLAQTLEDVIYHLLVDEYTSNKTTSYIVVMLENALREHSSAFFAVSVIKKVWETNQSAIEPFLGSLAIFAESTAKEHQQASITQTPNNTASMQQLAENGHQRNQLSATSTIGIFEVSCGLGFKQPSLGKDVQVTNGGFKNEIIVETNDTSDISAPLISSMRLLASSRSLVTFSRTRNTLIRVLRTTIDSSISLPVLMTAVSIIGKWIIADDHQMSLTKSEREGFLCQLAFFDFQRLPEPSSQALGDMICSITLSAYGYDSSIIQEYPFGFDKSCMFGDVVPKRKCIEHETFQQLLLLCLLSANPYVRSLSMGIFSTQVHQKLSNIAIESGCHKGDSVDTAGILGRCPSEILSQVLQVDFEALGMRLWTIVIVDFLLASGKHDVCVRLGREGSENQIIPGYLSLNNEKPQPLEQSMELNFDGSSDALYSSFTKLIMLERNEKLCGRGRCIAAIRNLIHGDVDTCQHFLEICFQKAWQCLPNNQARSFLIEPLGRLLSRPFHTQFIKSRQCSQMNAVQSMLRVLVPLRPMPAIDPFLLTALGMNYNASNEALSLLESQYIALKANGYNSGSSHDLIKAIQLCYDSLGVRDVSVAISASAASFPGTKFALSLDMYDLVNESSDAYLSLIDRADGNPADFLPTEHEMNLWEARWVDTYKEMSQWSVIDEFATSAGNANLMLEVS